MAGSSGSFKDLVWLDIWKKHQYLNFETQVFIKLLNY